MNTRSNRWLVLVLALALVLAEAGRASACGGLYCDRAPSAPDAFGNVPPVQAGEQIVYGVESDGSLVMSVRIVYNGAAANFAWILPVPAVPQISLGADALFATLDQATTPTFSVTSTTTEGSCAPDPACVYDGPTSSPGIGCSSSATSARAADAGGLSLSDAGAAADGGGLHVDQMGTVGPYETVVLSGGTGSEVVDWLMSHGYTITAESAPLLDDYASHGSHFVALRLHGDANVNQIQPVTLTMPATSPCLPIRLTALATAPDLPITAFFLGDGRAVSTNYSMLDPTYEEGGLYAFFDPQSGRSLGGTTSYASYVTRAVAGADGHAFVTDFAGATPPTALALPSLLDLGATTTPYELLATLEARGYLADPQIITILVQYVPPPSGMVARSFYNCLAAGLSTCGTATGYDPAGAIAAIDQTITQPRAAAAALLARHPYLTRLFTTMSAPDMTLDPEFRLDPALGDAPSAHGATLVHSCDASVYANEAGGYLVIGGGAHFGAFAALPHVSADAWCQASRGYFYRASSRGCGCGAQGAHRPPAWLAIGVLAILARLARRTRAR